MKRYINFRPLLFIFLTFLCSIFAVVKLFLNSYFPIIILGILFILFLVLLVVSIKKHDFGNKISKIFGCKSIKVFCILFLVSVIFSSSITTFSFVKNINRDLSNQNYNIKANVKEFFESKSSTKLLLNNVTVDGKNYNFKISLNVLENTYKFEVGDKVEFYTYLYGAQLVNNGKINTSILKTGIQYYCSVNSESITKTSGSAFFIDALKSKQKIILTTYMSEENAGFCYAVLCGDKTLLGDNYYTIFRNSGLAHLLAVSGLHIGFLVGLLLFLLKILKIKNKTSFWIVFAVLLIYNIMCEFAPSVFRASVMSLTMMLGLLIGERNDTLSSLGLAGIIVLTFQPLLLFDVGFLLSFGSVFGIFLIEKPIATFLQSIKIPNFLAEPISITISATIGTLPWIFMFFGEMSTISLISNIVVLPIFAVMFAVLIVSNFVMLIVNLPFFMTVAEFFVNITISTSAIFSKFAMIKTPNFDILCSFIFYFALFFVSPYFMMNAKCKTICLFAIINLFVPLFATTNTQKYYDYNSVSITGEVANCSLYTLPDNKKALINLTSDEYELKNVEYMLKEKRIFNIDYFLLFNYKDNLQKNVCDIAKRYNIKNVVLFGDYENSTLFGLVQNIYSKNVLSVCGSSTFEVKNAKFDILSISNNTKAVKITTNDCVNLHIFYALTESQISSNKTFFGENFKFVFCNNYFERYQTLNAKYFLCQSQLNISKSANYIGSNDLWTTKLCCDTI